MHLIAPFNETSFIKALEFTANFDRPISIRYPRGAFISNDFDVPDYKLGKSHLIQDGDKALFIGYGNGVGKAVETAKLLNFSPAILDLRFVKPLDREILKKLSNRFKVWFIFSETAKLGGVASAILEFLQESDIFNIKVVTFEYEDNLLLTEKKRCRERT